MERGQTCPECGASFAPLQDRIYQISREWNLFVHEVEFVMEIEKAFEISIRDEDVRGFSTVADIGRFISNALRERGCTPHKEDISAQLRALAADKLGIENLADDMDIFAGMKSAITVRARN
jgi:hypothetical protein